MKKINKPNNFHRYYQDFPISDRTRKGYTKDEEKNIALASLQNSEKVWLRTAIKLGYRI